MDFYDVDHTHMTQIFFVSYPFGIAHRTNYKKGIYIFASLYVLVQCLTRYAFLWFLMRIFGSTTLRKKLIVLLILNTAGLVAFLPLLIFQCKPLAASWTSGIERASCLPTSVSRVLPAAYNTAWDLISIVSIP